MSRSLLRDRSCGLKGCLVLFFWVLIPAACTECGCPASCFVERSAFVIVSKSGQIDALQFAGSGYDFPERVLLCLCCTTKPADDARSWNTLTSSTVKHLKQCTADTKRKPRKETNFFWKKNSLCWPFFLSDFCNPEIFVLSECMGCPLIVLSLLKSIVCLKWHYTFFYLKYW